MYVCACARVNVCVCRCVRVSRLGGEQLLQMEIVLAYRSGEGQLRFPWLRSVSGSGKNRFCSHRARLSANHGASGPTGRSGGGRGRAAHTEERVTHSRTPPHCTRRACRWKTRLLSTGGLDLIFNLFFYLFHALKRSFFFYILHQCYPGKVWTGRGPCVRWKSSAVQRSPSLPLSP